MNAKLDSLFEEIGWFNKALYELDIRPIPSCCIATYNKLYPCDAINLCRSTTNKEEWTKARQFRVTASRCYSLYTYSKGR